MIYLSAYNNRKRIALVFAIVIFIILVLLISAFVFNYLKQEQERERYEVALAYHNLVDEIQDFTNQNISQLAGFTAYMQMHETYSDEEIYTYLDFLLKDNMDDVRNISIFRDTTIEWTYPLDGNEEAIGVDLSKVPEQAQAIQRVKGNLETLFQGPVDLIQGGTGFIIRMPLVKNGQYWGMVSIVLKAEKAFEFIDDYASRFNVSYLITQPDDIESVIYGSPDLLMENPMTFKLKDELGGWDIYTGPKDGWENRIPMLVSFYLVLVLLSAGVSKYAYGWIVEFDVILSDKLELEKKYVRDHFTNIYTREYFNLRVQEEFHQAERHKYPISMIYFDLDHFKNVNDTYGHSAGDNVLLEVVEAVKGVIRTEDVFSRWGGDEFILLLPHTDLKGVEYLAERIRSQIETLPICLNYDVTASVGCAQWQCCEYQESWFSRTDKALYASKNTGRNRVTVNDHKTDKSVLVKVSWNNAWNSSNAVIDKEHRRLLDRCNAIIENSLKKSHYNETLREIEAFLIEIEDHFDHEIAIIRNYGYPEVDKHERIHAEIVEETQNIYQRAVREEISSIELFKFLLTTVIQNHVQEEDRKYFRYL